MTSQAYRSSGVNLDEMDTLKERIKAFALTTLALALELVGLLRVGLGFVDVTLALRAIVDALLPLLGELVPFGLGHEDLLTSFGFELLSLIPHFDEVKHAALRIRWCIAWDRFIAVLHLAYAFA